MRNSTRLSFRRTWRRQDSMNQPSDWPSGVSTTICSFSASLVVLLITLRTNQLVLWPTLSRSTSQTSQASRRLSLRLPAAGSFQAGSGSASAPMAACSSLRPTTKITHSCTVLLMSNAYLWSALTCGSTHTCSSTVATRRPMSTSSSGASSGASSAPTSRLSTPRASLPQSQTEQRAQGSLSFKKSLWLSR